MIAIIDYGMGNPGSIANMLRQIGAQATITRDAQVIAAADRLILPGVGAFDAGMSRLQEGGLAPVLNRKVMEEGTPILGICLGLQLFARHSEEGQLPGLGWIDAEVVKFRFENTADEHREKLRIPQMGWNEIRVEQAHPLLDGLEQDARFYFVHSYYLQCYNPEIVLATTTYGYPFHSIVGTRNILGTQFHPEKSHRFGMRLLENFARINV